MRPSGLEALLRPLTLEAFLESYWDKEAFFAEPHAGRLAALPATVRSLAPRRLTRLCSEPVKFFLREGGEVKRGFVHPSQAMSLYERGATLYFINLHSHLPAVAPLLESLRRLGAPGVRISAFASPAGARMPPHFDTLGNLTLHLAGRKRWTIAPNDFAVNPTVNFALTEPIHDELKLYCSGRAPKSLPPPRKRVDMQPGAVLYLPRGYWHETRTLTDSVAISFSFDPLPWVDVALKALRHRLLRDTAWRRNAYAWDGAEIRRRLKGLAREATRLRPGDLDAR